MIVVDNLRLYVACRYMSAAWSDRKVIHMDLNIADSGMKMSPGDSIGVMAGNDTDLVDMLLERLQWKGDDIFQVEPAGRV